MSAIPHDARLKSDYEKARAKYRIGERLRSCPICSPWQAFDRGCHNCDDHGVLPAKRKGRCRVTMRAEIEGLIHYAGMGRWQPGGRMIDRAKASAIATAHDAAHTKLHAELVALRVAYGTIEAERNRLATENRMLHMDLDAATGADR